MGNHPCQCFKSKTTDDVDRPTGSRRSRGRTDGEAMENTRDGEQNSSGLQPVPGRTASSSKSKRSNNSLKHQDSAAVEAESSFPLSSISRQPDEEERFRRNSSLTSSARNRISKEQQKEDVGVITENVRRIVVSPAVISTQSIISKKTNLKSSRESVYLTDAQLDATKDGKKSIEEICTLLWEDDEHLKENKHYKFSRKKGLRLVDENIFASRSTYDSLKRLLKSQSEAEEINFLDEVMKKRVIKICWEILNIKKYIKMNEKQFVNQLHDIWFTKFGKPPHSAFQHIFVGFDDGYQVYGLHNWIQYSLEDANGKIEYNDCQKQIKGVLIKMKYKYNGVTKPSGSMFVGTSPELELAIYSLLYFEGRKRGNTENIFKLCLEAQKNYTDGSNRPCSSVNRSAPNVEVRVIIKDGRLHTAFPRAI